jgi:hypothetical protein
MGFEMDDVLLAEESFLAISFILGRISASYPDREKTVVLLKTFLRLYRELRVGDSGRELLNAAYNEANQILTIIFRNKCLELSHERDWQELQQAAQELIELDNQRAAYVGYCNLSLAKWYLGDREGAIEATNEAANYSERRDAVHRLNKAYFSFIDGDYERGLKIYEGINQNADVNAAYLVHNLLETYDNTKDPAFMFAAGYALKKFSEVPEDGIEYLRRFLKRTNGTESYDCLREKADEIVAHHVQSKNHR